MKIRHERDRAAARKPEYPPIGDQLDAIWKSLAQADPETLHPATREILDQIRAVKERHP